MKDKPTTKEFWIGCALTILLSVFPSWTSTKTQVAVLEQQVSSYKQDVSSMSAKIDKIYDNVVVQDRDLAVLKATQK